MSKKIHKLKKKRYADLCSVKREIESSGAEKVTSFLGHTLITNKNRYTMVDSIVYVNGEAHGVS